MTDETGLPYADKGAKAADLAGQLGLPVHLVAIEPIQESRSSTLWRGRDRRLGMDVVIKVLAPGHSERIESESRAMGRLGEHPRILAATMVGRGQDGTGWLVTEQMAATLGEAARGASVAEVLGWAAHLADAIAFAHERGVVHGDVTPSNVLVGTDGGARLADFGCARLEGDSHEVSRSGHTPRYAAPERRRGVPATRESDLYGFGATMLDVLPDGLERVPRRVRRLLARCVRNDPVRRPDSGTLARSFGRR